MCIHVLLCKKKWWIPDPTFWWIPDSMNGEIKGGTL